MNQAQPYQRTPFRFQFQSSISTYIGRFWIGVLMLSWVAIFIGTSHNSPRIYAGMWVILSLCSLAFAGFSWSRSLLHTAGVFSAGTLPHRLWLAYLNTILIRAASMGALSVSGAVLLDYGHDFAWKSSAYLALACLALSLGFIPTLAPARKQKLAFFLSAIVALSYLFYALPWSLIEHWARASFWWHLPFYLPLMGLSLLARHKWRSPQSLNIASSSPRASQSKTHSSLWGWLKQAWLVRHRFSLLNTELARPRQANALTKTMAKLSNNFSFLFIAPVFYFVAAGWDAAINLPHLVALIGFAAYSSNLILCKDLHWRFLLLPKGLCQGRIGIHLFISSVTYYGLISLIVVALLSLMMTTYFASLSMAAHFNLHTIALFSVEIMAAFSLGIVLRGCEKPQRAQFYLFLFTLFFGAAISFKLYFQGRAPLSAKLFEFNFLYLACLIGVIVTCIIGANRLWTTARLIPFVARAN